VEVEVVEEVEVVIEVRQKISETTEVISDYFSQVTVEAVHMAVLFDF
jgi:hypothetical protein